VLVAPFTNGKDTAGVIFSAPLTSSTISLRLHSGTKPLPSHWQFESKVCSRFVVRASYQETCFVTLTGGVGLKGGRSWTWDVRCGPVAHSKEGGLISLVQGVRLAADCRLDKWLWLKSGRNIYLHFTTFCCLLQLVTRLPQSRGSPGRGTAWSFLYIQSTSTSNPLSALAQQRS